jgi:hypothetical protein
MQLVQVSERRTKSIKKYMSLLDKERFENPTSLGVKLSEVINYYFCSSRTGDIALPLLSGSESDSEVPGPYLLYSSYT